MLRIVSCAAKKSRMRDITVCYIHEQSILIECSPKVTHKKLPYVFKNNARYINHLQSLGI